MDKVKAFVRGNKKLVALVLAAFLTLAGVKLAPETTESLVNGIVEACCKEEPVPAVSPEPTNG